MAKGKKIHRRKVEQRERTQDIPSADAGARNKLREVRVPARRPGRPGRRQINILLSDDLTDRLLAAAIKNGRTLAAEVAAAVESADTMNRVFAGIYQQRAPLTALELASSILRAELRQMQEFGYVLRRNSDGSTSWRRTADGPYRGGIPPADLEEVAALLDQARLLRAAHELSEPVAAAAQASAGFEALLPGEWEAHAAAMTASEADIERRNAEAIRRSNLGPVVDMDAAIKRIEEIEQMAKAPAVVSADVQPNFDAYDQLDEVEEIGPKAKALKDDAA
jgi:hypothetical protein